MRPSVDGTPEITDFDVVHDALRERILRGDLRPGQEVSQVKLAREMGVSRTPLREAMRMLQREGLVDGQANRSPRVASFSLPDMEELYCARLPVEAVAIRTTVPRLASTDIAALEGEIAQMAHFAELQEYELWEVPHRSFHQGLTAQAGPRIATLLRQLSDHSERYRRLYTTEQPRAWTAGVSEHRAILDAVKARDADADGARHVDHLVHTVTSVIAMVDPDYDASRLPVAMAMAKAPLGTPQGVPSTNDEQEGLA
jgi:DNA-binding GntR family transcriptional regulator